MDKEFTYLKGINYVGGNKNITLEELLNGPQSVAEKIRDAGTAYDDTLAGD